MNRAVQGAALIVLCTGMMAVADGITKLIAQGYAAPQLFAIASLFVVAISLAGVRRGNGARSLRVRSVRVMALRCVLTVVASYGFFQAFRLLPFADVFFFTALMPLLAAVMSGPCLGETPRPVACIALVIGLGGMGFLMPDGPSSLQAGHVWGLIAVVSGTASMVAGRYIARIERVPLAQVFWPNLALMVAMGLALPFVWKPMTPGDLGWIVVYSAFLFGARYVMAEALRLLPAYVATPMINIQFVWMVGIGYMAFAEVPSIGTVLGVTLVITSSLWLVVDEATARPRGMPAG